MSYIADFPQDLTIHGAEFTPNPYGKGYIREDNLLRMQGHLKEKPNVKGKAKTNTS